MLPLEVPRVLSLGELALRRWLPLDALRAPEFARWFALPTRERALLRETVRPFLGELVDYGHFYVACSPLPLDALLAALDCPLAFAGQDDAEFVAEVVLEVYQSGIRIDMLRSCLRQRASRLRELVSRDLRDLLMGLLMRHIDMSTSDILPLPCSESRVSSL